MSHIASASNQGLLAYGITTNPDPIQASPKQGTHSMTSIVITVSNNTSKPIYCKKLTFSIPIGNLAQDLASTSTGILVSANPSSKWQISMTSDGVFIATPLTPDDRKITIDGLSFQIYNIEANTEVGTFTLSVSEDSSTDNKTFTNKNNTYNLVKFPYGFYVRNFAASKPMVNEGESVKLTWTGSDLGVYTILYGTKMACVTNHRCWKSPELTATTTFALKATAQEQGESVDTYLYVTVIVANPELVATSLKVSGDTILTGATTIGSTLDVTGTSIFTGDAVVKGAISMMMQAWIPILAGTEYLADTDGFAIGVLGIPGESVKLCMATITGFLDDQGIISASGGNIVYSNNTGQFVSLASQNSLTMPVPKGCKFKLCVEQVKSKHSIPLSYSCYWAPLGKTSIPNSWRKPDAC